MVCSRSTRIRPMTRQTTKQHEKVFIVNSLWPGNAIWWHRSGSTLAQVIAWCLMTTSHYLNQSWLIIIDVLWHSRESDIIRNAHNLNPQLVCGDYASGITAKSHPGDNELTFEVPQDQSDHTVILNIIIWSTNHYKKIINSHRIFDISMGQCKKDVTPLLKHWSYVFLALTHRYDV